jgi:hypothetical protein
MVANDQPATRPRRLGETADGIGTDRGKRPDGQVGHDLAGVVGQPSNAPGAIRVCSNLDVRIFGRQSDYIGFILAQCVRAHGATLRHVNVPTNASMRTLAGSAAGVIGMFAPDGIGVHGLSDQSWIEAGGLPVTSISHAKRPELLLSVVIERLGPPLYKPW